jgi:hypothetical protein
MNDNVSHLHIKQLDTQLPAPASGLLDLSRQQRNLLLLRPLFAL